MSSNPSFATTPGALLGTLIICLLLCNKLPQTSGKKQQQFCYTYYVSYGSGIWTGQGGIACLCSNIYGNSAGKTPMAGGDSNDYGLETSEGFCVHISGAWAGMT